MPALHADLVPPVAHALPPSVGAVPLTLLLTVLLAAFLAVNALVTRRLTTRDAIALGTAGGTAVVEDDIHTSPPRGGVVATAFGLGLGAAVVVLSVAGPSDPANNLADDLVLTLGWAAVALASMAAGPFWPRVNPVNAVARTLAALAGGTPDRPLRAGAGTAVVVALLGGWAVVQLLTDLRPTGFAILALSWMVGHALLAGARGPAWLALEPSNVMARTLGLLRPSGGGPLDRLTHIPDDPRLGWVSAALVGWSLVDLLLETEWWHDLGLRAALHLPVGLAMLTASIGLLGLLVRASSRRIGLAPAFVPVAAGWLVAHYLSILLIDGQGIGIWLSDPLGTGADLLGMRGSRVDVEPLPVGVISALQMVPFVGGHILAAAVVQRRAAARVRDTARIAGATLEARALIAALLLGGTWMQLAGL